MMGRISELLATQVALMQDLGSPIAGCVQPGHATDRSRGVIEGCGLAPTDEVLEWFGWFDGFACESTHDLFAAMEPVELNAAAARYRTMVSLAAEAERVRPGTGAAVWNAAWFPLLWHDNAVLAVDLSAASSGYGSVWNFDPHVATYTRMVASSLWSFLELLITETRRGSVVWVPESEAPAVRPGRRIDLPSSACSACRKGPARVVEATSPAREHAPALLVVLP
jgi:hypothetical protein